MTGSLADDRVLDDTGKVVDNELSVAEASGELELESMDEDTLEED